MGGVAAARAALPAASHWVAPRRPRPRQTWLGDAGGRSRCNRPHRCSRRTGSRRRHRHTRCRARTCNCLNTSHQRRVLQTTAVEMKVKVARLAGEDLARLAGEDLARSAARAAARAAARMAVAQSSCWQRVAHLVSAISHALGKTSLCTQPHCRVKSRQGHYRGGTSTYRKIDQARPVPG